MGSSELAVQFDWRLSAGTWRIQVLVVGNSFARLHNAAGKGVLRVIATGPLRAHLACHVTTALPSTIIDTFPRAAVGSMFTGVTVEVRGAEDLRPAVYALSGQPAFLPPSYGGLVVASLVVASLVVDCTHRNVPQELMRIPSYNWLASAAQVHTGYLHTSIDPPRIFRRSEHPQAVEAVRNSET
ncbi:hypothetical protein OH76DRAFT_1483326 [Lentinus brumalis]|uniref:Uncharacterized protein n=1 Tax=Lentinus brumalis TaxID=2498619 RepID=A0A371D9B5_9APHY|nr:hypothetical protein OH76DRAFT_1483326 [Polyporus brumalis]